MDLNDPITKVGPKPQNYQYSPILACATAAAMSNCILRGGALMICCTRSKSQCLHYPTTLAAGGCFSSKRWASLYPLYKHNGKTSRHRFSSFQFHASLETEAAAAPEEAPTAAAADTPPSIKEAVGALDIRVGRILKAWLHPEADSLYVEEVDVGEPEPRTICSGLVRYIPLDHLQGTHVVVLANLKPRNMRGVKSNGMLLAASDASHENVELLLAPESSVPGERIWFGLEEDKEKQLAAASPNQVQKKKIWETLQPHLKTDGSCVAAIGVHPMRTSAGVVVCRSLQNAKIS